MADDDDKNNLLQWQQKHQTIQREHVSKCIEPLQGISEERSFTKRAEYKPNDNTLKSVLLLHSVVQYFAETIDLLCVLSKNCHDLSFWHGTMLCCTCITAGCWYRWKLETLLLYCKISLPFTHPSYRHLAIKSPTSLWSTRATICILLSKKGWIHTVSENISISPKLRRLGMEEHSPWCSLKSILKNGLQVI